MPDLRQAASTPSRVGSGGGLEGVQRPRSVPAGVPAVAAFERVHLVADVDAHRIARFERGGQQARGALDADFNLAAPPLDSEAERFPGWRQTRVEVETVVLQPQ